MAKPRNEIYYYNCLTGAEVFPDDWQAKIKKGNHYEIVSENFPTIYGVILEPFREIGYYRVQSYSAWCVEGELGTVCIVEPTRLLTREEFEYARTQRWNLVEVEVE